MPVIVLKNFFVFLFFLLVCFEDSILQSTPLGYAGASLAVIPVACLVIGALLTLKINRYFLLYAAYSLFITIIFLIFDGKHEKGFLLDRALRLYFLYALFFFTVMYFKTIDVKLDFPFFVLGVVAGIGLLLSFVAPEFLSNPSFLHYKENINMRMRGFSLENSTFAFCSILAVLMIGAYYQVRTALLVAFSVALGLVLESKGALVSALLSGFLYFLFCGRGGVAVRLALVCFSGLLFIWIGIEVLLPKLLVDIENYTSFATRATLAILAMSSLVINPFGTGFSGYLPYFYETGPLVTSWLEALAPGLLNFSEVEAYFIVGEYKNISSKSLFSDLIIFFGLPFIFVFLAYVRKVYAASVRFNQPQRVFLLFYLVLSLTIYISGAGTYLSAAALGLIISDRFVCKK